MVRCIAEHVASHENAISETQLFTATDIVAKIMIFTLCGKQLALIRCWASCVPHWPRVYPRAEYYVRAFVDSSERITHSASPTTKPLSMALLVPSARWATGHQVVILLKSPQHSRFRLTVTKAVRRAGGSRHWPITDLIRLRRFCLPNIVSIHHPKPPTASNTY